MDIFNITEKQMQKTSSAFTLEEIYQQPATWKKTFELVKNCSEELQAFLDRVLAQPDFSIVLTGAGSSEFIGKAIYPGLNLKFNGRVSSVGSTDIVPSPESYLFPATPTLLVNFARSGDSPESVGNVLAAEEVCKNLYHLFITCNSEGALAKMAKERENCFAINLAPETNDRSFAMTSSFSNMYLAAYLAFHLNELDETGKILSDICKAGDSFLNGGFLIPWTIAKEYDFDRIVYLGNTALKGMSQESALKMLELTAGKTGVTYDSPMGFRHGPKSVINDSTLTVLYLSDDVYMRQYEIDLLREIVSQKKRNKVAIIFNTACEAAELADYSLSFSVKRAVTNDLLVPLYIMFAQTLAVMKSLSLDITPDNPCPTGEVNRVVSGVTLYPYKAQ